MKLEKLVSALIITSLLLGALAIFPASADQLPVVKIEPRKVEKWTDTTSVGSEFTVTLWAANFTDLYGYEYKIHWNTNVLNVTKIKDYLIYSNYFIGKNETDYANGIMWFVITCTPPGTSFTGTTKLREITFKIISSPPPGIGSYLYSPIDIYDDIFGDSRAEPIQHETWDGEFYYYYVPPPPPKLRVDTFTATFVGQTFGIGVSILDLDAIYQVTEVSFDLTFNQTLFSATAVTEGTFFSNFGTTTFEYSIDNVNGRLTAHVALTELTGPFPSGSGTIATITFEAIYGEVGKELTSPLVLENVLVKNQAGQEVTPSALINGWAKIAIPSPAKKAIGVEPSEVTVLDEGVEFTVDIYVYNITSVDKFFGVQFSLYYDPTLLELISVSEGPFLGMFPWATTPPYTFFYTRLYSDHITVVDVLLDGGTEPPGYVYPYGDGSVARITFRSKYGVPGATLSSVLDIRDPMFGNYYGEEIPVELIHDGTYYITLDKRYIDVYTQYPAPYGGQKRYHDADAYEPQALVVLYAYVSYNRWPIQNKIVEFEVHGPENDYYNIVFYRTAVTDENGIARIEFRIDWPCEHAEEIVFGTWTVYAAAWIDEVKIVDVLHFEVGWLIQITKITLISGEEDGSHWHNWHLVTEVEFFSISAQNRPLFLTLTVYDEAGYPLGSMVLSLSTVTKGSYKVEVSCLRIPKWARAGTATIYANAFTAPPTQCGVAYCPEVSITFTILPK